MNKIDQYTEYRQQLDSALQVAAHRGDPAVRVAGVQVRVLIDIAESLSMLAYNGAIEPAEQEPVEDTPADDRPVDVGDWAEYVWGTVAYVGQIKSVGVDQNEEWGMVDGRRLWIRDLTPVPAPTATAPHADVPDDIDGDFADDKPDTADALDALRKGKKSKK